MNKKRRGLIIVFIILLPTLYFFWNFLVPSLNLTNFFSNGNTFVECKKIRARGENIGSGERYSCYKEKLAWCENLESDLKKFCMERFDASSSDISIFNCGDREMSEDGVSGCGL